MADEVCLVESRHSIKYIPVPKTVVAIGVDSEIAHAKTRKVLEEMGALTGVYHIIGQSGLNNQARGTDMRPLHRNAQPRVARPLASWTYKNIIPVLIKELTVQALHLYGNARIVGPGKILICLDIYHIGDVFADAVAQRVV